MNGVLKLAVRPGKEFTVIGGPYHECPNHCVGVKMAVEIDLPCDIDVPTRDFSVPDKAVIDAGLLAAVKAITAGNPVYVGCMAGRGRTGLFLAILAKAFGCEHPVEYVRRHYYPHAVETDLQYRFVLAYKVPLAVTLLILQAWFFSYFTFKKSLTNLDGVLK